MPVTVRHMRTQVQGTAHDISPCGIYLFSEANIERGSDLELIFLMPPEIRPRGGRWVCCHAKVARVEDRSARRDFGIAAKITYSETVELT